jgi:hypothetical protein
LKTGNEWIEHKNVGESQKKRKVEILRQRRRTFNMYVEQKDQGVDEEVVGQTLY